MYFMFGILDKERRAADFRDCYPILDKKVESQFRQKAYAWYTGTSFECFYSHLIHLKMRNNKTYHR